MDKNSSGLNLNKQRNNVSDVFLYSPHGGRGAIFISAYACEPGLGSEIGVGWHWVLELAKEFEVWVLTRESNRARIESYFAHIPPSGVRGLPPNLHFLYFDLPKWARFWKKGLRGVRTYYNIWTRLSNKIVEKTMKENDIKVFHHLTYGNALWPVSKYGSSQTFVWGPIGGLETIPEEYSCHYDRKSQLIEKLRRIAVNRSLKSNALKKRVRKADLILCKTEETLEKVRKLEGKNVGKPEGKNVGKSETNSPLIPHSILFTDVAAALQSLQPSEIPPTGDKGGCIPPTGAPHIICVGRLDAWRGFDLAILALAESLKPSNSKEILPLQTLSKGSHILNPGLSTAKPSGFRNVTSTSTLPGVAHPIINELAFRPTLTIVGSGSDLPRLQRLVAEHNLEDLVTFTGKVSQEEYRQLMEKADIVLNPSLKEGAVTVSFDAMAMGKPLVALDTGGYTRYFKPDYSIVVPRKGREETIRALAEAILSLSDEEKRAEMGKKAKEAAVEFSWEKHGEEIRKLFESLKV